MIAARKLISLCLMLNVPPCDMLGNQLARNEILHMSATIGHSKFPSSSVIEFHKYKT